MAGVVVFGAWIGIHFHDQCVDVTLGTKQERLRLRLVLDGEDHSGATEQRQFHGFFQ